MYICVVCMHILHTYIYRERQKEREGLNLAHCTQMQKTSYSLLWYFTFTFPLTFSFLYFVSIIISILGTDCRVWSWLKSHFWFFSLTTGSCEAFPGRSHGSSLPIPDSAEPVPCGLWGSCNHGLGPLAGPLAGPATWGQFPTLTQHSGVLHSWFLLLSSPTPQQGSMKVQAHFVQGWLGSEMTPTSVLVHVVLGWPAIPGGKMESWEGGRSACSLGRPLARAATIRGSSPDGSWCFDFLSSLGLQHWQFRLSSPELLMGISKVVRTSPIGPCWGHIFGVYNRASWTQPHGKGLTSVFWSVHGPKMLHLKSQVLKTHLVVPWLWGEASLGQCWGCFLTCEPSACHGSRCPMVCFVLSSHLIVCPLGHVGTQMDTWTPNTCVPNVPMGNSKSFHIPC